MSARRSVRPRSGAGRRRTTWARVSETFNLAASGDYITVDLLASWKEDGGAQQAVTVARTHLIMSFVSTPVDPEDQFTWGLIRGQSTDVGTNIAGAPRPSVQPYEDWLLWESRAASQPPSGSIGTFWPGNSNVGEYDLKAMRKFEELGMTYNCVIESVSLAADSAIVLTGSVLLMLP